MPEQRVADEHQEVLDKVKGNIQPRTQGELARGDIAQQRQKDQGAKNEAIRDCSRELPPNFAADVLWSFQELPADALPDSVGKGRLNFTNKSKTGAAVEIQLRNRRFYYKKTDGGRPWQGKPSQYWSQHTSAHAAWEECKRALNWG